jgi:hypothetical protein
MSATRRFDFAIHAPPAPPTPPNPYRGKDAQRNILLYLIGENIHGPLSVFDVCLRATHLRGHANEEQVAYCLQSVLVNYNWLDGEISQETAQRDIERATGVPMTVGKKRA